MNRPSTTLKILLIDDHRLFLAGMANILATLAENVQVLQAADAKEALACVDDHVDLDWIFLDLQLPKIDGFQLMAAFRERMISAPVVILSANEDPATVDLALRRGASGYVTKSAHKDEIIHALAQIEQTGSYVSASLEAQLRNYRAGETTAERSGRLRLSERQLEVLDLMAQGYSNKRIAETLFLCESTIKNHVSSLLATLNARNRTQCIIEANKLGLIK
jgi:DNA-binding NarL/FixJ family response regulator